MDLPARCAIHKRPVDFPYPPFAGHRFPGVDHWRFCCHHVADHLHTAWITFQFHFAGRLEFYLVLPDRRCAAALHHFLHLAGVCWQRADCRICFRRLAAREDVPQCERAKIPRHVVWDRPVRVHHICAVCRLVVHHRCQCDWAGCHVDQLSQCTA